MLTAMAKMAVRVGSDSLALSVINGLSSRATRPVVTPAEQATMRGASKLAFKTQSDMVAWQFDPAAGTGPLVVLTHGWGGRAAQMAPLAAMLAQRGFCAVIVDIAGHGESPAKRARWEYFVRDISRIAPLLDREVHAYVAHSASGLAMMCARKQNRIQARKYVCICSPSHPFPPVRAVRAKLDPRESVIDLFKGDLAAQLALSWGELEAGVAFAGCDSNLLLVYDEKDRFIDHAEGDKLHALCPGSRLIKTTQYGHVKILSSPSLSDAIADFLRGA